MLLCFGQPGVQAIKKLSLRYISLDIAKEKIRLRLEVLTAALELTGELRKSAGSSQQPKPRQTKRKSGGAKGKKSQHKYDFCLSFAVEDRRHAEELQGFLRQQGARVFYDNTEKYDLWGEGPLRLPG